MADTEVTTDEETEDTETETDVDTSETDTETETDTDTDETETTLEDEIIEDLTAELSETDENFNATVLAVKVKSAIREVKRAKKYTSNYTDERITADLQNYYSNIRALALYDYNLIGAEGQSSSTENGVSRSYVDRKTLFVGIIPIAKI